MIRNGQGISRGFKANGTLHLLHFAAFKISGENFGSVFEISFQEVA